MTSKTPKFDAWVERRWGKKVAARLQSDRLCAVCHATITSPLAEGDAPPAEPATVGVWGIGLAPAHERLFRSAEARCPDSQLPDDVTVDPRLLWTEERPKLDGPPPATPLCPAGHPMVEFEWTDGGAGLFSCPQCDRCPS